MLKWISILGLLLGCSAAHATTYTAANCNVSGAGSVAATLALASSGDTVIIPAGTCTWPTPLSYTVPGSPGSITILGSGNLNCPASCDDATTIIDNVDHNACNCATILITTGSANSIFRLSGITITQNASSISTDNGIINIKGSSQNVRLDHYHCVLSSSISGSSVCGDIDGWNYGVIDHNLFDLIAGSVNNGIRVGEYGMSGGQFGNGAWSSATNFGAAFFMFFENNIANGGALNDCNDGGRQVLRYNTLNASFIQEHEDEGDLRGCRATEAYNNTFNGNISYPQDDIAVFMRMGPTLMWSNAMTNMQSPMTFDLDRTQGPSHGQQAPPMGWGYCGTTYGPSSWDGNSISAGYPCFDQIGRGQGDVLSGAFSTKCNLTTNPACNVFTGQWPHNKLEPVYEWLNQWNPVVGDPGSSCHAASQDTNNIAENRDFFCYTLTWNSGSYTGTAFNGTVGTGSGLLSARPSTCTAGAGGTYGTSPVGSYGVAYWGTDTNTLYICTATNTWTASYTPYVYPHPLVTPSGLAISPTSLPGGTIGVSYSQTLTASGGVPPYAWVVTAGSLPTSLSLNASTGVISGTPTVLGGYSFTISAFDSTTPTQLSGSQPYSVTIGGAGSATNAPCLCIIN